MGTVVCLMQATLLQNTCKRIAPMQDFWPKWGGGGALARSFDFSYLYVHSLSPAFLFVCVCVCVCVCVIACNCFPAGSTNSTCDSLTGQCMCVSTTRGVTCDMCESRHFNITFSNNGNDFGTGCLRECHIQSGICR